MQENEILSQEQQQDIGGPSLDNGFNFGKDEDDDNEDDDDDDNQDMHPALTRSLPASARGAGTGRGRGVGGRGGGRGGGGGAFLNHHQKMAFKNSSDAASREVEADVAISPSLNVVGVPTMPSTNMTTHSVAGSSAVGTSSQQRSPDEDGQGDLGPQGEEVIEMMHIRNERMKEV